MRNTMIKYHFYKCTIEPKGNKYYDHSNGIAGFLSVQDRKNYIGYMPLEDVIGETPYKDPNIAQTAANRRGRYTNVTRNYNSRY